MRKLSTKDFISKAMIAHGNTYSYEDVVYVGNKVPVVIKCAVHGNFTQTPSDHLVGKGCILCGLDRTRTKKTKQLHQFVIDAREVHGTKYTYHKVVYKNNKSVVTITCPIHGDFEQRPLNHIKDKQGCPVCGKIAAIQQITKGKEQFVAEAVALHGDVYSYESVEYVTTHTPVAIICKEHGTFKQAPDSHLHGRGCPRCAKSGFDPTSPGTLYYLRVQAENGDTLYKIGITNLTVQQRFTALDLSKIHVLSITTYEIGANAYAEEQRIMTQFKEFKYKGQNVLSSGNTELFIKDVLGVDHE